MSKTSTESSSKTASKAVWSKAVWSPAVDDEEAAVAAELEKSAKLASNAASKLAKLASNAAELSDAATLWLKLEET